MRTFQFETKLFPLKNTCMRELRNTRTGNDYKNWTMDVLEVHSIFLPISIGYEF